MKLILEHEIKVTKRCKNDIQSKSALELFDLIGEEGIGIRTIDQELGKLHAQRASGE